MTPLDRWSIVHACEELVYRAAHHTDNQAWEQLAAMFVQDGRLVRPSDRGNPIVGRTEILASLKSRPARTTTHVVSNIRVQITAGEAAHISSVVVLFAGTARSGDGPSRGNKISVGHFEDDVVLGETGWAFVRRDGSIALEYPFE